jgi:hypothetical protein
MKQFVESNYNAIFLIFLAMIIVLSFLTGRQVGLQGFSDKGIVFSCSPELLDTQKIPTTPEVAGVSTESAEITKEIKENNQKGLYVGSKNGTKYYTPGCSGTNRIKPENYIWFQSVEDATLQGYTKGSC